MNPTTTKDSIVQKITISSSARRIFEALTDPAQLVKLWGVEGRFHATHVESNLRPAGQSLMRGNGMNGRPFTVRGTYREINCPYTLVFTWLPDWEDDPSEMVVRIDLEETGGVTRLRLAAPTRQRVAIHIASASSAPPLTRAVCLPSGPNFSTRTHRVSATMTTRFITPRKQQQHQGPAAAQAIGAVVHAQAERGRAPTTRPAAGR